MTAARRRAVVLAAAVCSAGVCVLVLTSDREDATLAWAVLGPIVVWSFVGTGLYATSRRPGSRVGALMVALGFAWCVAALSLANSALAFSLGLVTGGLWGGVFLHLLMSFPTGRLAPGADRRIVLAGYALFTVGAIPALLFSGPEELACDDCPRNLWLVEPDADLATALTAVTTTLYVVLLLIVVARLWQRRRRADPLDRPALTPVYACGIVAFLVATAGTAADTPLFWWVAFGVTALLPLAFLGGLLRSHVARLDAELVTRLQELRASRVRLVNAGDAERRRLERDLHDGAQSRLVSVNLLLGRIRLMVEGDAEATALLDRAQSELRTGLAELRELARGIHPAVLTDRGLEPAIKALASRAPVPVTVEADEERLLPQVEIAAYFAVSEALTNVAKYAQASAATVSVRRADGILRVEVADDGVGGADPSRGSGLSGLADRLTALDGTIAVDSPPGGGTRVRVEIPCEPQAAPYAVAASGGQGSAASGRH
jgi:signal transduction histidine kinase